MVFTKNFIILIISCLIFLKAQNILPGQKNAIKSLATSAGFSQQELDSYLTQNYGKTLNNLSQREGANLISGLQDGSIKKPSKRTELMARFFLT